MEPGNDAPMLGGPVFRFTLLVVTFDDEECMRVLCRRNPDNTIELPVVDYHPNNEQLHTSIILTVFGNFLSNDQGHRIVAHARSEVLENFAGREGLIFDFNNPNNPANHNQILPCVFRTISFPPGSQIPNIEFEDFQEILLPGNFWFQVNADFYPLFQPEMAAQLAHVLNEIDDEN